ncbi:Uncharacterized conserved protein [Janthinobacterium sp. Marseille]|nr:methyltransferase domain-containing protein [Janthinobacterium sp. Marseille]ABR91744.1 Uncharacterized conserved protein [Janthinobacterium sp. Marseille]
MTHVDIALAYDEIADSWLDGSFNPHNGIESHKRAINFLEPGVDGWALNVGCGCNTRFNRLLRAQGLKIEGIDISQRMVELAGEADPAVVLHHDDVCKWEPPRSYRFISAWDSIWHVDLEKQRPLMLKLMTALKEDGVFIFSAGGLDTEGFHVDSSMGPEVYYSTLGINGFLKVIEDAGCVLRHLEFDQLPQKHLVVIVQRRS